MSTPPDPKRVCAALEKMRRQLYSELAEEGHWIGELSSSALATAVAVIALGRMGRPALVEPGLRWLAEHANPDGGWGDTIRSASNLSTTALVWAAFGANGCDRAFFGTMQAAEAWLWRAAGSRENLPKAIADRYGKDRTFSVPILMTLALSGRLGADGWRLVPGLPFELAALPRAWFGALQLPVVSYALPALIAIGQVIHHHAPSRNPFARILRQSVRARTLTRLEGLQPPNGGFLEATPLTAFVTMSLASMGLRERPVARRGATFLEASVRPDGSWPIDTNLATWMTTLAIKSLESDREPWPAGHRERWRDWLLGQQGKEVHPYTGAAPGGWAWTDLPGGVPDADDTAGALLALAALGEPDDATLQAAGQGVTWLLDLQNRDGGIPTFCRGWGALPFDRSAPELTAHAMQAWYCWRNRMPREISRRIDPALARAADYLEASQRRDGAWIPLWFGNEHAPAQENPVYGTARTLIALNELQRAGHPVPEALCTAAGSFLRRVQLPGGGWGGDAGVSESLEETALAVEALAHLPRDDAWRRGAARLLDLVEAEAWKTPTPIGLYFARLWYFERLYPILFAASALKRVLEATGSEQL